MQLHFGFVAAVLLTSPGVVGAQAQSGTATKQVFNRLGALPGGVFSPVVRVGDVLYLSGVLGTVPGGGLAEGGIEGQTRQALENVRSALALAGATMADVSKCTVFLTDVANFAAMNKVYHEYFPSDPLARSAVAVAALVMPNALLEIECIVVAPKK